MKNFIGLLVFIIYFAPTFSQSSAQSSSVKLKVFLSPAGSFISESTSLEGSIVQGSTGLSAKSVLLDLGKLKSGIELRDEHMKKKYFEVEKFPKAILKKVSTQDNHFEGELELHGVLQKISGDYKIKDNAVQASFKTQMSLFKIPSAEYMGVGAKDEVQVEVELPLEKASVLEKKKP